VLYFQKEHLPTQCAIFVAINVLLDQSLKGGCDIGGWPTSLASGPPDKNSGASMVTNRIDGSLRKIPQPKMPDIIPFFSSQLLLKPLTGHFSWCFSNENITGFGGKPDLVASDERELVWHEVRLKL
jgi:hypothetical protein